MPLLAGRQGLAGEPSSESATKTLSVIRVSGSGFPQAGPGPDMQGLWPGEHAGQEPAGTLQPASDSDSLLPRRPLPWQCQWYY